MTELQFTHVTEERWQDLERLFGPRGAVGGCWCMHWRSSAREYESQKGEGNKSKLQSGISSGNFHGILAYVHDRPVGWCAVGPRTEFPRLEGSRIARRIDQEPVWSIVCFFITKEYRRTGLSAGLIKAAVSYAAQQGAKIIEAYPVEPKSESMPALFAFTGMAKPFLEAGFIEVARRSETRPVLRFFIGSPSA